MLAASLLAIGLAVAGLTFSFLTYWIGAPLVSLLWNSHSPSISSLILAPIFALAFTTLGASSGTRVGLASKTTEHFGVDQMMADKAYTITPPDHDHPSR